MKNFDTLKTESFLFWSYSFQLLSGRDSKKMSEKLVKIVEECEINALFVKTEGFPAKSFRVSIATIHLFSNAMSFFLGFGSFISFC